jgi:hypothetical protein
MTASLGVVLAMLASTAYAGTDNYVNFNQGLNAGNAVASTNAHGAVWSTDGYSDHTFCPALAQGYSSYTSTPFSGGNVTVLAPACGPGFQQWRPGRPSASYHGAVYNPNTSTKDIFNYAQYCWDFDGSCPGGP